MSIPITASQSNTPALKTLSPKSPINNIQQTQNNYYCDLLTPLEIQKRDLIKTEFSIIQPNINLETSRYTFAIPTLCFTVDELVLFITKRLKNEKILEESTLAGTPLFFIGGSANSVLSTLFHSDVDLCFYISVPNYDAIKKIALEFVCYQLKKIGSQVPLSAIETNLIEDLYLYQKRFLYIQSNIVGSMFSFGRIDIKFIYDKRYRQSESAVTGFHISYFGHLSHCVEGNHYCSEAEYSSARKDLAHRIMRVRFSAEVEDLLFPLSHKLTQGFEIAYKDEVIENALISFQKNYPLENSEKLNKKLQRYWENHYPKNENEKFLNFLNLLFLILNIKNEELTSKYCCAIASAWLSNPSSTGKFGKLISFIRLNPAYAKNVLVLVQGIFFFDWLKGNKKIGAYIFDSCHHTSLLQPRFKLFFSITHDYKSHFVAISHTPEHFATEFFRSWILLEKSLEKIPEDLCNFGENFLCSSLCITRNNRIELMNFLIKNFESLVMSQFHDEKKIHFNPFIFYNFVSKEPSEGICLTTLTKNQIISGLKLGKKESRKINEKSLEDFLTLLLKIFCSGKFGNYELKIIIEKFEVIAFNFEILPNIKSSLSEAIKYLIFKLQFNDPLMIKSFQHLLELFLKKNILSKDDLLLIHEKINDDLQKILTQLSENAIVEQADQILEILTNQYAQPIWPNVLDHIVAALVKKGSIKTIKQAIKVQEAAHSTNLKFPIHHSEHTIKLFFELKSLSNQPEVLSDAYVIASKYLEAGATALKSEQQTDSSKGLAGVLNSKLQKYISALISKLTESFLLTAEIEKVAALDNLALSFLPKKELKSFQSNIEKTLDREIQAVSKLLIGENEDKVNSLILRMSNFIELFARYHPQKGLDAISILSCNPAAQTDGSASSLCLLFNNVCKFKLYHIERIGLRKIECLTDKRALKPTTEWICLECDLIQRLCGTTSKVPFAVNMAVERANKLMEINKITFEIDRLVFSLKYIHEAAVVNVLKMDKLNYDEYYVFLQCAISILNVEGMTKDNETLSLFFEGIITDCIAFVGAIFELNHFCANNMSRIHNLLQKQDVAEKLISQSLLKKTTIVKSSSISSIIFRFKILNERELQNVMRAEPHLRAGSCILEFIELFISKMQVKQMKFHFPKNREEAVLSAITSLFPKETAEILIKNIKSFLDLIRPH